MEAMLGSESSIFAALLFGLLFLGTAVGTTEAIITGQISFGDSLADVGTNVFINNGLTPEANFPPYGRSFFFPLSPTGNPTGRSSNGLLVADYFAIFLGLPFPQPYLALAAASYNPFRFNQGANFASTDSGILNTTNAVEGVINLPTQIAQFLQMVATLRQQQPFFASQIISNSLFAFTIGSNDITYYLSNPAFQLQFSNNIQVYVELLAFQLISYVQVAIDNGARKIIVSGLGPLGCAPRLLAAIGSTTGACVDSVNQIALLFNSLVSGYVNAFNAAGIAKVTFANSYQFVLDAIQNGQSLGFTKGTTACCGSGAFNGASQCGKGNYIVCSISTQDQYVFWDYTHPTQKLNSLVANLYYFGGAPNIQPYNGFQLETSL